MCSRKHVVNDEITKAIFDIEKLFGNIVAAHFSRVCAEDEVGERERADVKSIGTCGWNFGSEKQHWKRERGGEQSQQRGWKREKVEKCFRSSAEMANESNNKRKRILLAAVNAFRSHPFNKRFFLLSSFLSFDFWNSTAGGKFDYFRRIEFNFSTLLACVFGFGVFLLPFFFISENRFICAYLKITAFPVFQYCQDLFLFFQRKLHGLMMQYSQNSEFVNFIGLLTSELLFSID